MHNSYRIVQKYMKKLIQMVETMIVIDANGRDHDQRIVKGEKGRPMHNQSVDCRVRERLE